MIDVQSPLLPPSFVQSRLGLQILVSTVDEYRHVFIGGHDEEGEEEEGERDTSISSWDYRARKTLIGLKSRAFGMNRDEGNEGWDEVDGAGLEAGLRG